MKKNKAWLKEELVQSYLKESKIYLDGKEFEKARYFEMSKKKLFNLIDQLDEPDADQAYKDGYNTGRTHASKPDKLLIPKIVADWWGRDADSVTMYGKLRVKKKHKFDLISIFYDKGLGDYLSKVEDWIYENDSAFLDLVNGKPYEVEKEKLYYVLDKQGKTLLVLMGGEVRISWGYVLSESTASKDIYQLTEKQIKDYDERFWQFAVEVAE